MKEVNISGSTELTAAVVNAVKQLKEFNCRRLRHANKRLHCKNEF